MLLTESSLRALVRRHLYRTIGSKQYDARGYFRLSEQSKGSGPTAYPGQLGYATGTGEGDASAASGEVEGLKSELQATQAQMEELTGHELHGAAVQQYQQLQNQKQMIQQRLDRMVTQHPGS